MLASTPHPASPSSLHTSERHALRSLSHHKKVDPLTQHQLSLEVADSLSLVVGGGAAAISHAVPVLELLDVRAVCWVDGGGAGRQVLRAAVQLSSRLVLRRQLRLGACALSACGADLPAALVLVVWPVAAVVVTSPSFISLCQRAWRLAACSSGRVRPKRCRLREMACSAMVSLVGCWLVGGGSLFVVVMV
jgi:hypothetical protein